jgi:hypothetical protein
MHPVRERILAGTLCRNLCTKGMAVTGYEGQPADLSHPTDTALYWCSDSGWAAGPDGLPANPGRCGPGRGCFRTEVEPPRA